MLGSPMSHLSSQLAGRDQTILIVRLPSMVTDEQVAVIQDEVRSRLPRVAGAGLVFDLAAVELINSIGITCILQVEEHCRKSGAAFLLASVPAPIAQFLRQLKLDKRFPSRPTPEDAIAALDSATR
jgi:anti-anti-sigma factor